VSQSLWFVFWLVGWSVGRFVLSFVRWLVGSFVRWFIRWLVGWLVGSFVRSFVGWLVRSLVGWFVGWLVRSEVVSHRAYQTSFSFPFHMKTEANPVAESMGLSFSLSRWTASRLAVTAVDSWSLGVTAELQPGKYMRDLRVARSV
jgi:hypothetical protein